MKIAAYLLIISGLIFASCEKDKQKETDNSLIESYIAEKNLTALAGEDGLYYVLENEGTGVRPGLNNKVTVHYKGYLLDGFIFDSSYDRGQAAVFQLAGVIRGWQLGIPKFREGGKGKLLIPSHLAYGSNPPSGSGIPANSVLIFDIELLRVE